MKNRSKVINICQKRLENWLKKLTTAIGHTKLLKLTNSQIISFLFQSMLNILDVTTLSILQHVLEGSLV